MRYISYDHYERINKAQRHSRAGGIAKTGVEANIGLTDGPEGEQHEAVRNPARTVHPELVEGFIESMFEWFDRLTMNVFI